MGIRTLSSQFQTRSTQSTIHSTNPQQEAGALVTSTILPGWRATRVAPVNTHSAPVLPKWEEAVGSSQAPQPDKPNTHTHTNHTRNYHKTQEIFGKLVKSRTRFGHDMVVHGLPKGPKTVIFPNALFVHFPWDLSTFSAEGFIQTPQKALFLTDVHIRKSSSCMGKVQSKETPCMKKHEKNMT